MHDSSSSWPERPLGELFDIARHTVTPGAYPGEQFAHYSIPAWDDTRGPALEAGVSIGSAKIGINQPTILVSKLNPRIPRVVLVENPMGPRHCASTEFIPYVAKAGGVSLRFYKWLLQSPTFQRRLERIATGSTNSHTRAHSAETLRWPVAYPSLEEQSRIAAVLDTVDEAIAKTEAVIAKLKQVRAGLLHDLLTRGLDEHGQLRDPIAHPDQFKDSPLGQIPREWDVGLLDDTVSQPSDLTIGPFGSNLLASDYRPEGAPVVFVRDVREHGFIWNSTIYVSQDKANALRAHSVVAGDVLITKMGLPPCIAAIYPDTMPSGVITADLIRLRPRVDVATSFWLTAYINSPRFAACVRQITGGVTRPKVTLADFRKQQVLLPSTDEQERIKNIIMSMARGIEEVEAELQKFLMLKSGLMTDLLTGRVRVPEFLSVVETQR